MTNQEIAVLLREVIEQSEFALLCCDDVDDRMYHAKDGTWWKRVGWKWVSAEPPNGWKRKEEA